MIENELESLVQDLFQKGYMIIGSTEFLEVETAHMTLMGKIGVSFVEFMDISGALLF